MPDNSKDIFLGECIIYKNYGEDEEEIIGLAKEVYINVNRCI